MKFYPTPKPQPKPEDRSGSGLANEPRPGIGDIVTNPSQEKRAKRVPVTVNDSGEPKAKPYAYNEPLPEPREQISDSLAQEQERSTGVSGHSSSS